MEKDTDQNNEAWEPEGPDAAAQDEETPPSLDESAELRRKAAEYDVLEDRLKRVTADYRNAQKRLQRQMEERTAYAIEAFARELLVVADDLARAVAATREHQTVEAILQGLNIVEKHLQAVLERHGMTPVKTAPGSVFDPEVHEAISVVETDEYEPNRVVEETQKGFLIHKRLLRPAQVVVSGEPETEGPVK